MRVLARVIVLVTVVLVFTAMITAHSLDHRSNAYFATFMFVPIVLGPAVLALFRPIARTFTIWALSSAFASTMYLLGAERALVSLVMYAAILTAFVGSTALAWATSDAGAVPNSARARRISSIAKLAPLVGGAACGGAWMNSDGSALLVGITDAARADEVRRAGAEPVLVRWPLDRLEGAPRVKADPGVHSWRIDVANNRVVVTAEGSAHAFIAKLGLDPTAVVVERSTERPRPLYDLRGGDEYIINSNTLCSIGFAVHGGFVAAGHCGRAGSPTAGGNWFRTASKAKRRIGCRGSFHGMCQADDQRLRAVSQQPPCSLVA